MATQLTPPSKVSSPGSHFSVSRSNAATVPNPTPLTEALDSEVVDPPPEIDFQVMTKLLAPIAEGLNAAAEEAMYPTPPINTPAVTPTTSVVYRYPYTRSRGLSNIGDRLTRAMAENRISSHDPDVMSNSGRSIHSPVLSDDESNCMSDLRSDGVLDKKDAPDPPRINPMGLISFTSNDLADRPSVPFNVESASATGIGSGSLHPDSAKSAATGVTEMSTWREEVEGRFERAVQSLENLARDEYQLDPSKPMEHYYEAHLKRLLGGLNRKIPVSIDLAGRTQ